MRYASLPPSSNHAGAHLIFSPSFHPLSLWLFDMLKLLLSHMLNGIFCFFQSLCSFVVPLSHFAYFALHNSSAKTWNSLGKCCSVFTIFTLLYLPPHLSRLLVSHFPVLATTFFSHLFYLSSSVRLSLSLSISSCVLFLFPLLSSPHLSSSSSSFLSSAFHLSGIGALYLASYSHLNWLAVNFRPPIAKWLISLSLCLSLSLSFILP